ncbi:rod shape-determining protein MreD [Thiomicrospira microaerophila]|uniref:rod shape-determining protein MreD n=1 Tax=Thiomicrospira microaerophila TaxID=406020 RepID=UPI0005C859F1|nr:rod shape-determining protein MreD [Thiomicrospira microaerophila]
MIQSYHDTSFQTAKFIVIFSYFAALVINVFAIRIDWLLLMPPITLLVLMFWVVQILNQTHLYTALALGLLHDALHNTLLGSHSLLFIVITFIMLRMRLRFRSVPLWQQSLMVGIYMLLFQTGHFLFYTPLLIDNALYLYWSMPLASAFIWPAIVLVLGLLSKPSLES